jgi:hypothetical protein
MEGISDPRRKIVIAVVGDDVKSFGTGNVGYLSSSRDRLPAPGILSAAEDLPKPPR